ncbi:MAG TPA: M15 family metallopeptidase [Candidatus Saccharimonadales bacterium]|nr:M15 family metallopeptidase [Candidatus Saccharimonadales bacterium]
MTLEEKLERSRSTEKINFSKFQSIGDNDPLVEITNGGKIIIEPCWTLEGDWEGQRYRDYIAEHPNYKGVYVRSELASRVQLAANAIDDKYRLVIRAGHRPVEVQKRILIDCANDYKVDNPGTSDEDALEHARTFVSDPDITLPPHVCGAAVDVEVLDATTGQLLDFGSKLNDDNEKSFLYYPDLTDEQKNNRLMLVTAMLDAGLASCKPEWWHFSYGDQVWAWFYGKENSLYSPVDL